MRCYVHWLIEACSSRDLDAELRSKNFFQQIFVRILNSPFVIFDDFHFLVSLIVRVRSIWSGLALRTPCRPAMQTSASYSPVRGGTYVLPQRRRPRRTLARADHPFVRFRIRLRSLAPGVSG